MLELPRRGITGQARRDGLMLFSQQMADLDDSIGFKISARGWCYQLEGFGLITKAEFDFVEKLINTCRREGYLPIDFTAQEEGRQFSGIEIPETMTPVEYLGRVLRQGLYCEDYYTPDWWDGEDYYIQMVVEKIDVKTLFAPVCGEYHIPIATAKGWSSMLMRAEYARRFKEAEDMGLKCVLLYCGDHDPDGLRISEALRANLDDLAFIRWGDGVNGYDPADLEIDRFGLNYDFIIANNLTWIDNLITGAKEPCPICGKPKNLADPHHRNHKMDYVQSYLREIGERKCEANALVVRPQEAEDLVRNAIEAYLGSGALDRFRDKREVIVNEIKDFRSSRGLDTIINTALEEIENS